MSTASGRLSAPLEAVHWYIDDREGDVVIVCHRISGALALVSWDAIACVWQCSECAPAKGNGAPQRCAHVIAGTRDLPLSLALRLSHQIGARKPVAARQSGQAAEEPRSAEEPASRQTGAGSAVRATRAAEHDRQFRAASAVAVRQQTDEDRRRLQLARERKRRLRGDNVPDDVPVRIRS